MGVKAMLEPHSSTKMSCSAGRVLAVAFQAARSSSLRSVAPSVFFSRPAQLFDGSTHRPATHDVAMHLFPEQTVLLERGIIVGAQLLLQPALQHRSFLRSPPGIARGLTCPSSRRCFR